MSEVLKEVREKMEVVLSGTVGDLNDETTWKKAQKQLSKELNGMIDEGKIFDYSVRCDATINTPDVIDACEFHIDAAVKVDKDSEFVFIPGSIKPN